jgi:hypothetical protein
MSIISSGRYRIRSAVSMRVIDGKLVAIDSINDHQGREAELARRASAVQQAIQKRVRGLERIQALKKSRKAQMKQIRDAVERMEPLRPFGGVPAAGSVRITKG